MIQSFDLGFNLFPVVTEHVMAHTTVADLQFLLCMHFALVWIWNGSMVDCSKISSRMIYARGNFELRQLICMKKFCTKRCIWPWIWTWDCKMTKPKEAPHLTWVPSCRSMAVNWSFLLCIHGQWHSIAGVAMQHCCNISLVPRLSWVFQIRSNTLGLGLARAWTDSAPLMGQHKED